jgi:hypothetical protein
MTKPEFTMQINLGTLIPIGLALIGLASWTGSLGTQVETLSHRVELLDKTIDAYEVRLRALETVQSGTNVRLDSITDSIVELREAQRETNSLLRDMLKQK